MDDNIFDTLGLMRRELRDVRTVASNIDHRTRALAAPAPGSNPRKTLGRLLTCHALGQKNVTPAAMIAAERYGNDPVVLKALASPGMIGKSASAPALTTVTGWAAELATPAVANVDFLQLLIPNSVYGQLSQAAGSIRVSLAGHGSVRVPTRAPTPTLGGSFVGEGAPIPIRQAGFSTATLTPKKTAVISAYSREMLEVSVPNVENVVRAVAEFDTAAAIDSVLLDSNAATAIRPPGILNGAVSVTAVAGGGLAALLGDLRALALAIEATGPMFAPVLIMSSSQALILPALLQGGVVGLPVIAASSVTAKTIIMLDAANFASAEGDEPNISTSKETLLHMEDTNPLQIGTTGSPATIAAPAQSMFQTDSVSLKMVQLASWLMTRSGRAAFVSSVTW